jgi:hypothetical protein
VLSIFLERKEFGVFSNLSTPVTTATGKGGQKWLKTGQNGTFAQIPAEQGARNADKGEALDASLFLAESLSPSGRLPEPKYYGSDSQDGAPSGARHSYPRLRSCGA